jgi:hypothetical protein
MNVVRAIVQMQQVTAESSGQSVREWFIAVGTVGATMVALYVAVFRERWRRPKLSLEYGGRASSDAVIIPSAEVIGHPNAQDLAYVRLRVIAAKRRAAAEDVEVMILDEREVAPPRRVSAPARLHGDRDWTAPRRIDVGRGGSVGRERYGEDGSVRLKGEDASSARLGDARRCRPQRRMQRAGKCVGAAFGVRLAAGLALAVIVIIVAGCGGGANSGSTSQQSERANVRLHECVSPTAGGAVTNAEGIVKQSGAPTTWAFQKQCLEEDAKKTSDDARRKAAEAEIAKGDRETAQGERAAQGIESKAEEESIK